LNAGFVPAVAPRATNRSPLRGLAMCDRVAPYRLQPVASHLKVRPAGDDAFITLV